MDDVTRALEKAAEAIDNVPNHTQDFDSTDYARAAVLACVQSLPPTMTIAELAAAIERDQPNAR